MSDVPLLVEQKRDALKSGILALGAQVEAALDQSLEVLRSGDLALARRIVEGDVEINQARRVLEQQALVVLAAYQPAGADLRMIGASLEMISEMERIADYAADNARILLHLGTEDVPDALVRDCVALGEAAVAMFVNTLAAYTAHADETAARAAAAADDEVDRAEQVLIDRVMDWLRTRHEGSRIGVALLSIAHNYERVADRATNLAERIVYIATAMTPDLD